MPIRTKVFRFFGSRSIWMAQASSARLIIWSRTIKEPTDEWSLSYRLLSKCRSNQLWNSSVKTVGEKPNFRRIGSLKKRRRRNFTDKGRRCSSRRKVTYIFYSTFQRFDHFQILERFVVADSTQHGNDDLGRFQVPLIDHELTQSMKINVVIDIEKRTRLEIDRGMSKAPFHRRRTNSHRSSNRWESLRISSFPNRRRTVVG